MARRLFIGVVTHEGSRFRAQATDQLAVLAERARARGWDVITEINARDGYSPDRFPLSHRAILQSAVEQAGLEFRWRRYLGRAEGLSAAAGAARWVRDVALLVGTTVVRTSRYAGMWPFVPADRLPGAPAVVRLLNIDLSHLALLGQAQGSDWALILEDDARAEAGPSAMDSLLDSIDALAGSPTALVNASRSIEHGELGVTGLLGPCVDGRRSARVPVTNTVCAVLYSASMLTWLPASIEDAGLVPVVPIDWRLNRAIMDAVREGRLGPGSCVWLDPAPFLQGSMRDGLYSG